MRRLLVLIWPALVLAGCLYDYDRLRTHDAGNGAAGGAGGGGIAGSAAGGRGGMAGGVAVGSGGATGSAGRGGTSGVGGIAGTSAGTGGGAGGRGGGSGNAGAASGKGGAAGISGVSGTTGVAGNCVLTPGAAMAGPCTATFNFESGTHDATINIGSSAFTNVSRSSAYSYCGSGALAIAAQFSGTSGATTKGEVLINLPGAPLDLTGKTVSVHVASDPGCNADLNLSLVLNTQAGPMYFPSVFPISPVNNSWKTATATVAAGGGATTALAVSLQAFSSSGYHGTIYVDEVDVGTPGAGGGTGSGGTGGSTSGLVLWYKMDETSGSTAADSSGNARNGTLTALGGGAGTFSTTHQVGTGALSLNGTSSTAGAYVSIPASLNAIGATTAITIATWVNITTDRAWAKVFDFNNSSTTGYMTLTAYQAQSTPNSVRFAITTTNNTAEQQISTSARLSTGAWHHIVLVLDAGSTYTGTIYIDGAAAGTNPAMTLRPSSLGNTTNNWIGRSAFTADPLFSGLVDDFRIYNRALTATEIAALYTTR